jgi:DNA-binding LytR/AlgR family response regulator
MTVPSVTSAMEAPSIQPKKLARILLVEDEAIVRRDLEITLKNHGHEVVGACATAEEAVELCEELRPHVVLMDIHLREGSGVDAANLIKERTGTPVIFISANSDSSTLSKARLAVPHGFITKPFKAVDVIAAVDVALYNHDQHLSVVHQRDRLRGILNGRDENACIFIRQKDREEGIPLKDIHYVEALKDYVGIHVKDRRYVIHSTMTDMERRLPADSFLRVHRSYIVRIDRIMAVDGPDLIMDKQEQAIPIGVRYAAMVRQRLALDRNSL